MERRIQRILLFIFLFIFIILGVFVINFSFNGWNGNVVQAVSEDIKMDYLKLLFQIMVLKNGISIFGKMIFYFQKILLIFLQKKMM